MQTKMPIRVRPFEHQRNACDAAIDTFYSGRSHGYALLLQMGCGKSLTAIGIAGRLFLDGTIRRVLVVAPLSVLGVWEEEFAKYAGYDYILITLEGSAAKKTEILQNLGCHSTHDPDDAPSLTVAVVNYESAWRLEKEITAWRPDLIIADEAHKIKTHNTAASKAMHRIGAKTTYRLLLTGTIITNKALDVFSQYKFLNPAIFGNSFYTFRNRYFDMTGYGGYTPALKRHMEPELTQRMHSIAFRATKAECLDLPDMTDIVRPVPLEPTAMKLYRALVKDSYAELDRGEVTAANVLTRLLRLSQLTGGFVGDDDGNVQSVSTAKLDMLEDIIDSAMEENRKLVIIARFLPEIAGIRKLLEKRKIKYSCITGDIPDCGEQVRQFQNDPEVMVFVGQIATAGLGITLTAASTMIFYSLDFSMSNFEQARARIHRAGQKEKCTYLYLVAQGTVDAKVFQALRDKADLAKLLVDDYRKGLNPFTWEEKNGPDI
ncbi:MAG: DEAD/DEAH box helicase [Firmicutes bacterium]|nr:DEAD/DEAH box helicase [Bacillota bacterium]